MSAYASQKVTYGAAFLNSILAAWKTAPLVPLIAGAKVRLSLNPSFNPQANSTIASLAAEEANYSGYTAGGIAVSLSGPLNFSASCQGVITTALFEAATATPFVPNTVYGYWIDDGTNVIAAEAFPVGATATFGAPGDFLELVVQLPEQSTQVTV